MTRTIAFCLALLLAAVTVAEAATSRRHRGSPRQHYAARTQPKIACTVLGCAPVPRGCTPTEGRTFTGMPTGHDIVICPPGVAPFR